MNVTLILRALETGAMKTQAEGLTSNERVAGAVIPGAVFPGSVDGHLRAFSVDGK
jgi:hypothetical protein